MSQRLKRRKFVQGVGALGAASAPGDKALALGRYRSSLLRHPREQAFPFLDGLQHLDISELHGIDLQRVG